MNQKEKETINKVGNVKQKKPEYPNTFKLFDILSSPKAEKGMNASELGKIAGLETNVTCTALNRLESYGLVTHVSWIPNIWYSNLNINRDVCPDKLMIDQSVLRDYIMAKNKLVYKTYYEAQVAMNEIASLKQQIVQFKIQLKEARRPWYKFW